MNYSEYFEYIKGKNVGFLGLGRSNMPLIRLISGKAGSVTVRDRKDISSLGDFTEELSSLGVKIIAGEDYLSKLGEHDIVYKTPAIRPDKPEIIAAEKSGTVITCEMELFFKLCPCKIFAVTGSDGKTTTTTLIYEMLKKEGYTCHLGGNIGRPLIGDIEKIKPTDMAVVELSSFQLFGMTASPDVSVITNLSENHLDWHKDFSEYIDAKKNIFVNQNENSLLVLNKDNAHTFAMKNEAKGALRLFSLEGETDGVYLKDGKIFAGEKPVMNKSDIILPGIHNTTNYMAAIAAVRDFVSDETIVSVARTFGGVEHRIEFVREKDSVSYYNDSIGSSPARTEATLLSFADKVILIAGGYDKKLSYAHLGEIIEKKVKHLVLIGQTSDKIEKALPEGSRVEVYRASSFSDAVEKAAALARPGDNVVLSPASASFDMFRDFEERGRVFKDIVRSL